MAKCGSCIHKDACAAWIRHGETLYDDFEYSVEKCEHYAPMCYVCQKLNHGWCEGCGIHVSIQKKAEGYCDRAERRTE